MEIISSRHSPKNNSLSDLIVISINHIHPACQQRLQHPRSNRVATAFPPRLRHAEMRADEVG